MKNIGTIVRTIQNHKFAVALPEGNFLVWDENELREEDYGKQALVEYDPQDQFCHFKCFYAQEATKLYI